MTEDWRFALRIFMGGTVLFAMSVTSSLLGRADFGNAEALDARLREASEASRQTPARVIAGEAPACFQPPS